jgi:hypothetical protein
VAINTITDDVGVVVIRRQPRDSGMAVVAIIATGYVRGMLAGCNDAIMTRAAAAENLCMVDGDRRYPDGRTVTILAHVCGKNVRRVLAGCVRTIVAIRAVARDIYVVEVSWSPTRCCVAVVTVIATLNMTGVFASCDISIVTGTTTPKHTQMIDREYRAPGARSMAVLADGRRLEVCRRFASGVNAIVA